MYRVEWLYKLYKKNNDISSWQSNGSMV
jgi:hypothetical protein